MERQALIAGDPSDTWLALALAGVCVAEITFGAHRITVALPTSSTNGSKSISALTTRASNILFLAVALTGSCIAFI